MSAGLQEAILNGRMNFWKGEFDLFWPGFLTVQAPIQTDSLRLHNAYIQLGFNLTQTRFNWKSIHQASSVIDSTQNSQTKAELNRNWFWIWIDFYISDFKCVVAW